MYYIQTCVELWFSLRNLCLQTRERLFQVSHFILTIVEETSISGASGLWREQLSMCSGKGHQEHEKMATLFV
jgi:hypothetical protein